MLFLEPRGKESYLLPAPDSNKKKKKITRKGTERGNGSIPFAHQVTSPTSHTFGLDDFQGIKEIIKGIIKGHLSEQERITPLLSFVLREGRCYKIH